jgi:pimeloyl-ACP methyl ester carboxylesterase
MAHLLASCVLAGILLSGALETTACGPSSDARSARPSASARLDGCIERRADVQPLDVRMPSGEMVDGVLEGSGTAGVVLANQSDEDFCGWASFARLLAGKGYRVLLFDYGSGSPSQETAAAAEQLRALGAQRVFLIGASKGAKSALIAATEIQPPVTGVISLSAERMLQRTIDVLPYAQRLTVPVLFVTATNDEYGAADDTKALYGAAASHDKQLMTVQGSDHGTALVRSSQHAEVVERILGFLAAH